MKRTSAEQGYYRFPTLRADVVAFVCEDDLWLLDLSEERARRLTAGVAEVSDPAFSPDGERLAFVGRDEGPPEVYVMPVAGGRARRLTWHGDVCRRPAWRPDGASIVYATAAGQPHAGQAWLHEVALEGGLPGRIAWGAATAVSFASSGAVAISRFGGRDAAFWKRYRGGTAGQLWVDAGGRGDFQPLIELRGNLHNPVWIGDRVFFLSDHEGIGNVYSCLPDGSGLERHSGHSEFYARNLAGDGRRLVYQCGGDLFLLEPGSEPRRLEFTLGSARTQRNRKFVPAKDYLDSAALSGDGSRLAVTSRGKAFELGNWEGAVRQLGVADGVRYRELAWLGDDGRLVAMASADEKHEVLTVLNAGDPAATRSLAHLDLGRALQVLPVPGHDQVLIANHRGELLAVDLAEEPTVRVLDSSEHGPVGGLALSSDSRWVAYEHWTSPHTCAIKACRLETGETAYATRPALVDRRPTFDPSGRYLYFIGSRDFEPVYDSLQFDLSFPYGSRPYCITLRADVPSPFELQPRSLAAEEAAAPAPAPVEIDFEGIEARVRPFPVPEGRYDQIAATADAVLFTLLPVESLARVPIMDMDRAGRGKLQAFDLATQKLETVFEEVSEFELASDRRTLLYRSGDRLRVVRAGLKAPEVQGPAAGQPGRQSGWIDLDRVKLSVDPGSEWRQMLHEAWRLQLENFWTEDLSGVDWDAALARYAGLLDRVTTRSEFSDLVWELQGELGTSHAYEMGGDHRRGPNYRQGSLAADFEFDAESGAYRLVSAAQGDPWDSAATSPLHGPGLDIRPGDALLAINGQPLDSRVTPGERLVNLADTDVALTIRRGDGRALTVTVRALGDERPARYRDWVESKRAAVHAATGGRVGYVHVPNMMSLGFGEFHRGFLVESDRDALIVDVRFNGGGHVSPLLLAKLARRRLGYSFPRRFAPHPYPPESPAGPLVAITNEQAGSDGDIFSHCFKLMRLGPLVGKRTWGGVVGISPSVRLADGTLTTQPEASFFFDDVGWGVENYGTDPDHEVDIRPQDHARGLDPQLEKAIELALAAIQGTPPHRPRRLPRPVLASSFAPADDGVPRELADGARAGGRGAEAAPNV